MKSVQISEYGDVSSLSTNETEVPTLKAGEVLVEVYATSLNPVDNAILNGYMKEMMPLTFPATLGGDIAGVVTAVADDVTNFTPGDKVFGQSMAPGGSGAFAEYATASAGKLALMPSDVNFEQAASLPLAGASALQALSSMNLSTGKKFFVNGGAGGIGTIAVQIAKSLGAYVAVTAGAQYADQLKTLGADEVIDYKTQNFVDVLSDYDAVLDNVRAESSFPINIVKKGGVIVSLTGSANQAEAEDNGITAVNQFTQVSSDVLSELGEYVANGALKPTVGKQFNLSEITDAFALLETGSVLGKIVVTVKAN